MHDAILMRAGVSRLRLGAQIELPGFDVSQEASPRLSIDGERRLAAVLRVPDADQGVGQEGHFDAAAVGVTRGSLPPDRAGEQIRPDGSGSKLMRHFITYVSVSDGNSPLLSL